MVAADVGHRATVAVAVVGIDVDIVAAGAGRQGHRRVPMRDAVQPRHKERVSLQDGVRLFAVLTSKAVFGARGLPSVAVVSAEAWQRIGEGQHALATLRRRVLFDPSVHGELQRLVVVWQGRAVASVAVGSVVRGAGDR